MSSVALLELVVPPVEVDVEHDHGAGGEASQQEPGKARCVLQVSTVYKEQAAGTSRSERQFNKDQ